MSQAMYNKKTRTARASLLQLTKMIDYFYLNKGLAEGKLNTLHGKEETQKKWVELTNELNSFQGATKTVEQWQVVWRDFKSRTSIKVKDLRKAKALTGNKAIAQPELTELEQRVIGIIGAEYVEGNKNCADSIPEEENLLEELEHGNKSVLSVTPQVISVCTNTRQEIPLNDPLEDSLEDSPEHPQNANSLDDNNDLIFDNDCSLDQNFLLEYNARNEIGDSEATQNVTNSKSRKVPKAATSSIRTSRSIPYPLTACKPGKQSNSSSLNINTPNSSKRVIGVTQSKQLYSLRENFQSIAQKQADAQFIHAESTKIQAEASKMNALAMNEIARAIQKLADTAAAQTINDTERIRIFEKLTTILENLLPTYLNE